MREQQEKGNGDLKRGKNSKDAANGIFASCSFSDLGLHPNLCQHLHDKMGFEIPTKIQARAIPDVISGKDVLVNAATGTGKTIVYLAPIVHLLQMYETRIKRSDGTYALVLVPTQELCMQVYEVLQKIVHRFHWIVPGYIMGGENRAKEKARLRKGISILIATPGRLLDHLKNTSSFVYTNLRWVVFDEADRILELGFGKAIEEILDLLGSRQSDPVVKEKIAVKSPNFSRQNLLLSATLNEKVNQLANISLVNPLMVGLDDGNSSKLPSLATKILTFADSDNDDDLEELKTSPTNAVECYNLPAQLIQKFIKVSCGSRLAILLSVLRASVERDTTQKIVVFFSTCAAVDFHYSLISEFKWFPSPQQEAGKDQVFLRCKPFRLHGNMEHDDRRTSFQEFKSAKAAILLCTDIAARGLDFEKLRCIIQYDSPGEASEYVHSGESNPSLEDNGLRALLFHRVGRTARLGEKGEAILFLQPVEVDYLHDLEQHGVTLQEYPLRKVLDSFPLYGLKHINKKLISLDMHPWVISLQKALENFISTQPEMKALAKETFCSWVRAYTAHRGALKRIFMVKKLHLGHVARSFGLKDQPSLVGGSFRMQVKKRKSDQKQGGSSKRRRVSTKGKRPVRNQI